MNQMCRNAVAAMVATVGVLAAAPAHAQVIARWVYNGAGCDLIPTAVCSNPVSGSGAFVQVGPPLIGFRAGSPGDVVLPTANNFALDLSPWPQQGQGSGTSGAEWSVSTAGFSNIVVSWDQRHSGRMSRFVQFQYSTDGVNFSSAGLVNNGIFEATNGENWYADRTVDLSGIPAVNNNPNFKFRVVAIFAPRAFTNNAVNFAANTGYQTSALPEGNTPYDNGGRTRFDRVTVRQQSSASTPVVRPVALPAAACAGGGGAAILTAFVTPGAAPASTGITVSANLSALGGSASQSFRDDGQGGDAVAGDNRFSFTVSVPGNILPGSYAIPYTVTDAQGRSGAATATFIVTDCVNAQGSSPVVISQLYGSGGAFSAAFNADFVELFNRSSNAVDVSGWSLQYAGDQTEFTADRVIVLPANTVLQPGRYFQVQVLGSAGSNGLPLIPDYRAVPGFDMSQFNGKVALVRNGNVLTGCPTSSPDVADLAAYGVGNVCFLGSAPGLDTQVTTGFIRKGNGCQDTRQNFNDFFVSAPSDRTSFTPANICNNCRPDYNADGVLNTDDISDYITDYFTDPVLAGPGGYAQPCPGAPAPFNISGYKADYNADCVVNTDDISDFITGYFQGC